MRAQAYIELTDTAAGGLEHTLPSPCRSLLLTVDDPVEPRGIQLGVQIRTDSGEVLTPGTATTEELSFGAEEADLYIIPGRGFILTYPRRAVGSGRVVEVLPF